MYPRWSALPGSEKKKQQTHIDSAGICARICALPLHVAMHWTCTNSWMCSHGATVSKKYALNYCVFAYYNIRPKLLPNFPMASCNVVSIHTHTHTCTQTNGTRHRSFSSHTLWHAHANRYVRTLDSAHSFRALLLYARQQQQHKSYRKYTLHVGADKWRLGLRSARERAFSKCWLTINMDRCSVLTHSVSRIHFLTCVYVYFAPS